MGEIGLIGGRSPLLMTDPHPNYPRVILVPLFLRAKTEGTVKKPWGCNPYPTSGVQFNAGEGLPGEVQLWGSFGIGRGR